MGNQTWSVIIMCYNEAGNLPLLVHKLQQTLTKLTTNTTEIIIVNDGSTDESMNDILALAEQYSNVRYIDHMVNKGIGHTLLSGYKAARYENVTALPGDGQFDPDELLPFGDVPEKHFVSFYRIENTHYSMSRNILSWINKILNRLFLGIRMHDVNWVKIYKRSELQKIHFAITSSLIETEICSKLLLMGNCIREVESKYLPRQRGKSRGASLKIVMMALRDILKLILVIQIFRITLFFSKKV